MAGESPSDALLEEQDQDVDDEVQSVESVPGDSGEESPDYSTSEDEEAYDDGDAQQSTGKMAVNSGEESSNDTSQGKQVDDGKNKSQCNARAAEDGNEQKNKAPTKTRDAEPFQWLGGPAGVKVLVQLKATWEPPIDFRNNQPVLPNDSAVFGAEKLGHLDDQLAASQEQEHERPKDLDAPWSHPKELRYTDPHTGRQVDWEQWFQELEVELRSRKIPIKYWTDALILQAGEARGQAEQAKAYIEDRAQVPPAVLYEATKNRLLRTGGRRYSPENYYMALHRIRPGEKSAANLKNYIETTATNYEAARRRASQELKRWPMLSVYAVTWIFYNSLSKELRRICAPIDSFRNRSGCLFENYTNYVISQEELMKSSGGEASTYTKQDRSSLPDRSEYPAPQSLSESRKRTRPPSSEPVRRPCLTSPTTDRQRVVFCFHCGSRTHRLPDCANYLVWKSGDVSRCKACPKCCKYGHRGVDCTATRGARWIEGGGPSIKDTYRGPPPSTSVPQQRRAVLNPVGTMPPGNANHQTSSEVTRWRIEAPHPDDVDDIVQPNYYYNKPPEWYSSR